jgi:hypothetical protein
MLEVEGQLFCLKIQPPNLQPIGRFLMRYCIAVVKGRIAIFRALLMAMVISLWCLAQLPEILRGMIFPLSVTK